MSTEETIRNQRESQLEAYEKNHNRMEKGEVVTDALPFVEGRIADSALGVGICESLLGNSDEALSWFGRAANHSVKIIELVDEYEDSIEDSYQWHQPTQCSDALYAAILSQQDAYIDDAISHTYDLDQEWILENHSDFSHVLYHALALAAYIDGNESQAISWNKKLSDIDHEYLKYDGLQLALAGLIEEDSSQFSHGLEKILSNHHDKRGTNPDAPTQFVSVEGSSNLLLTNDVDIDPNDVEIEDSLRDFLLPDLI
ncbi:hypothetical protein [Natrinema salaciae]|uniref:Uncharacterized protein n=1 Tax=Natrinema salaciae TaxID=1186196 RepID=A0A1H9P3V3_9EURY|nr:hypothetical protein [Natrinema salaciae]SER42880.1 hypothetical protein SAMN04489841_3853 [Natrinema salaciae]